MFLVLSGASYADGAISKSECADWFYKKFGKSRYLFLTEQINYPTGYEGQPSFEMLIFDHHAIESPEPVVQQRTLGGELLPPETNVGEWFLLDLSTNLVQRFRPNSDDIKFLVAMFPTREALPPEELHHAIGQIRSLPFQGVELLNMATPGEVQNLIMPIEDFGLSRPKPGMIYTVRQRPNETSLWERVRKGHIFKKGHPMHGITFGYSIWDGPWFAPPPLSVKEITSLTNGPTRYVEEFYNASGRWLYESDRQFYQNLNEVTEFLEKYRASP
jgi:hypothetical protein